MKLVNIHKNHLTNALHLQFILEVIKLIRKFNSILLKIPALFENLSSCAEKEERCYKISNKSDLSDLKMEIDHIRDTLVLGIKKSVKLALVHFDEKMINISRRVDKWTSKQGIYKHADDADSKGFSQIRKKSVVIFLNMCHRSSLRGTKLSSVSFSWIASCLAMTNNDTDLKRCPQIFFLSVKICINLCHLCAYCLNQDSQDYRMSRMKTRLLVHSSTCPLVH
jgi:hypothetical protein